MLPSILEEFFADYLDEIAGGRLGLFALDKANKSLRPIVISDDNDCFITIT